MISESNDHDMQDGNLLSPQKTSRRHLRQLSRSPHPYHRRGKSLQEKQNTHRDPSASGEDSQDQDGNDSTAGRAEQDSFFAASPRSSSESGTEADDERGGFLKLLPAPSSTSRKGLRGSGNDLRERPLPTPSTLDLDLGKFLVQPAEAGVDDKTTQTGTKRAVQETDSKNTRRKLAEVVRRLLETSLLGSVGYTVYQGDGVAMALKPWRSEISCHAVVSTLLYALHPLKVVLAWARSPKPFRKPLFRIPVTFDPAPLLYPLLLPIYVSLSLMPFSSEFLLPNLILSLASLPPRLIPFHSVHPPFNVIHWLVASAPLLVSQNSLWERFPSKPLALKAGNLATLEPESLILLFPLHQVLLPTLEFLTTTSLLPAELQLLSIALINLLWFARSPNAEILKSMLWIGGLGIFVLCAQVLNWEVALARVPSWRFQRSSRSWPSPLTIFSLLRRKLLENRRAFHEDFAGVESSNSESDGDTHFLRSGASNRRLKLDMSKVSAQIHQDHGNTTSAVEARSPLAPTRPNGNVSEAQHFIHSRRHTFSAMEETFHAPKRAKTTPSGRPKRALSSTTRSLLNLTVFEAVTRRWLYALYTYLAVMIVILLPIRKYVSGNALQGHEPFGWALGYLFGNLPSFRLWVVTTGLESWIPLPVLHDESPAPCCHLGWLERVRVGTFGPANMRLVICAYFILVLITGLAIVLRLSSVVEVDTRRKVFHGMMVAMFLPTTFIDPTFISLALSLVLSLFLLLDLFRASQLPPISKPLTYFLAPYVDGRDHRGPVIVSHIFLLIGCAIPLWLSLAGVERVGEAPWTGWEISSSSPVSLLSPFSSGISSSCHSVSMVSGVICVGMGDAAASLVGRRYGRRKWFFSGGKSLEGSFAFATAVAVGLVVAREWLDFGGWKGSYHEPRLGVENVAFDMGKMITAAMTASLTEAVLTGGNDNVVVPLMLWLMVRGLGV